MHDTPTEDITENAGNLDQTLSAITTPLSIELSNTEHTSPYDSNSGPKTKYSVFGGRRSVNARTATAATSSADTHGIFPSPVAE